MTSRQALAFGARVGLAIEAVGDHAHVLRPVAGG